MPATTFFRFVLSAVLVGPLLINAITVSTPMSLIACQPNVVPISEVGDNAYAVAKIGDNNGEKVADFHPAKGATGFKYTPTVPVGTEIMFMITDDNGVQNYSNKVKVEEGPTQCSPGAPTKDDDSTDDSSSDDAGGASGTAPASSGVTSLSSASLYGAGTSASNATPPSTAANSTKPATVPAPGTKTNGTSSSNKVASSGTSTIVASCVAPLTVAFLTIAFGYVGGFSGY